MQGINQNQQIVREKNRGHLVLGGELELTNLKKSMVQGRERKLPLPMKNAANAHQIICKLEENRIICLSVHITES